MRKLTVISSLLAAVLSGCAPDPVDEHLVVDGWIEDGGYPVVIVTSSLPVKEGSWSEDDLSGHVLHWATVTVSDGEGNSVTLTGMKDENYFPPYVYTTTRMKGEAGKTYSLTVRYGETEARAVTTIPSPRPLSSITPEKEGDGYVLRGRFTPRSGEYYSFFTRREGIQKMFLPAFLTLVDGDAVSSEVDLTILAGMDLTSSGRYDQLFHSGETVHVLFCTMDRRSYEFWRGYEEAWMLTHNPFFPVTSGVPSNVEGGYGCWAGYGASFFQVDIP